MALEREIWPLYDLKLLENGGGVFGGVNAGGIVDLWIYNQKYALAAYFWQHITIGGF